MIPLRSIFTLALTASLLLSTPALAAPEAGLGLVPLTTAPGNMGVAIPFRFAGRLGETGLMVQSTPTMLLVRSVAKDSPAALADVPSPGRYRVRVAAVDGRAIEDLDLDQLLKAFASSRDEVKLTVGRKVDGEYAETLVGPFVLPLSRAKIAGQKADWLAARRRFDEAREVLGNTAPTEIAERALLEAHDAAAGGDHRAALNLTAGIGPTDPLYPAAMRLRARVQEARSAEIVAQADLAAARGDFGQALQIIRSVTGEGSWGVLRRLRETDWRRAVVAKAAYRKDSKLIRAERARAAAAKAQAQRAARAAAQRRAVAAAAAARAERRRKRLAGRRRMKL